MRAALYARVSTTEQAEEGHSVEAQVGLMRAHCERQGWEVAAEYVDIGISGKLIDRPKLSELMTDAKERRFDVVVVHKLDRFYRNLPALLNALERLAKWDVSFMSLSENMDFSTPWGKLALVNLGILAEIYLDNLSAETSKGKRQRAKEGQTNASILPYGYTRDENGHVVTEPSEADAIRTVFERYAHGDISIQSLAYQLNRAGYRTRMTTRFGSRPWSKDTLTDVLRNPFYAGLVRHGDDEFPGHHEPIISMDVWERCKALRAHRARAGRGSSHNMRFYLLSRIARCHDCHEPLRCQNGQSGARYRCTSLERGLVCPSARRTTRSDAIDAEMGKMISEFKLPGEWREQLLEDMQSQERYQDIEAKRKRLAERLRRLAESYVDMGLTEDEFKSQRRILREKLAMLETPEVKAIFDAGEFLKDFGTMWQRANDSERKQMVNIVFDAVYVDLKTGRITGVAVKRAFEALIRTNLDSKLARLCLGDTHE